MEELLTSFLGNMCSDLFVLEVTDAAQLKEYVMKECLECIGYWFSTELEDEFKSKGYLKEHVGRSSKWKKPTLAQMKKQIAPFNREGEIEIKNPIISWQIGITTVMKIVSSVTQPESVL